MRAAIALLFVLLFCSCSPERPRGTGGGGGLPSSCGFGAAVIWCLPDGSCTNHYLFIRCEPVDEQGCYCQDQVRLDWFSITCRSPEEEEERLRRTTPIEWWTPPLDDGGHYRRDPPICVSPGDLA